MESLILLNSNENTKQVEDEEKSRFVRYMIESLGLPIDEIEWNDDGSISLEHRAKLKKILEVYEIQVINQVDGSIKVFHTNEGQTILIGEWKKPQYVLKRDYHAVDPKKKTLFGNEN